MSQWSLILASRNEILALALNLPCHCGKASKWVLLVLPSRCHSPSDTFPLFETWTALEPCPEFFFSLAAHLPERRETVPRVSMEMAEDHHGMIVGKKIMFLT